MNESAPASITDDIRLVKHSLIVAGHRTSISLEGIFWRALKREAARRHLSIAALVQEIDATRGSANLSSALRVHIFRIAQQDSGGENDPPSQS